MEAIDPVCQEAELKEKSRSSSRFSIAFARVGWHLRREGLLGTLKKALLLFFRPVVCRFVYKPTDAKPKLVSENLDLQPGDWVEVKSREEILLTLTADYQRNGLFFMPEMFAFCGKTMRVYRRVERIILENTPPGDRVRRLKHTVILDGAICEGTGLRCDKSCFYFWREAWLRRLPGMVVLAKTHTVGSVPNPDEDECNSGRQS